MKEYSAASYYQRAGVSAMLWVTRFDVLVLSWQSPWQRGKVTSLGGEGGPRTRAGRGLKRSSPGIFTELGNKLYFLFCIIWKL